MNCVSCDICVYHLRFCVCVFPGVFLSSRVTGACPVTTDLIMRLNVRTTTTTTTPLYLSNHTYAVVVLNLVRLSLGKLLVNLLQVVKRTNTPLTP